MSGLTGFQIKKPGSSIWRSVSARYLIDTIQLANWGNAEELIFKAIKNDQDGIKLKNGWGIRYIEPPVEWIN